MKKMSDEKTCSKNCPCISPCPLKQSLSVIGGKWKIQIICALKSGGTTRYNDLIRKINGITNTMLASSLKELEQNGLVTRTVRNTTPLKVEYSITDKSEKLVPILKSLVSWYMDTKE